MHRLIVPLALVSLFGCSTSLPLDNRPCPCSGGWLCCDDPNICVREGTSCPSPSPSPSVTISPMQVALRLGAATNFTTNLVDAVWSVAETGGGVVDGAGHYTAPLQRGSYHVVVASSAEPANRAMATVIVGPNQLELLAGSLGGSGNADGVGPDARFSRPTGVTGDAAGNLYVADIGTSSVRKIDIASGAVTTLASDISSTYGGAGVSKIVVDGDSLYFIDAHRVWTLKLPDGAPTAIAGQEMCMLNDGMGGHAVDGVGDGACFDWLMDLASDHAGHLYVVGGSNFESQLIRKVDVATGTVTTVAGILGDRGYSPGLDGIGSQANFKQLKAITNDGMGGFLISDMGGGPDTGLRRFDPVSGQVTTLDTSIHQYDVFGISVGSDQNTYLAGFNVVVQGDMVIAGKTSANGDVDAPGVAAQFSYLQSIWTSTGQDLLVADATNCKIRRLQLRPTGTYDVSTLAGKSSHAGHVDSPGADARFMQPGVIAADSAGNLFVVDSGIVRRIDHDTQVISSLSNTPNLGGGFNGIAFDAQGDLIGTGSTSGFTGGAVYVINLATNALTGFGTVGLGNTDGPADQAQFDDPQGVVAHPDGSIYVADRGNNSIRKLSLNPPQVGTLVTGLGAPAGIATDGAGTLFVAEATAVKKVDIATGAVSTLVGPEAGFVHLTTIVFDPAGLLYVNDSDDSRVRTINAATGAVGDLVGVSGQQGAKLGALPAGLNQPIGIALLPSGDLVISDRGENALLVTRAR